MAGTMISNIVRNGTSALLPVLVLVALDNVPALAAMASTLSAVHAAVPGGSVADVELDHQERTQELRHVLFGHRREDIAGDLLAERGQARERGTTLLGKVEAIGPPVTRVRPPFHQILLAQAVDQTQERDRLNLEGLGHLGLGHAFLSLEPRQRAPLRTRHAVLARPLVDVGSHRARHIGELEQDFSSGLGGGCHRLIISKLIIDRSNEPGRAVMRPCPSLLPDPFALLLYQSGLNEAWQSRRSTARN